MVRLEEELVTADLTGVFLAPKGRVVVVQGQTLSVVAQLVVTEQYTRKMEQMWAGVPIFRVATLDQLVSEVDSFSNGLSPLCPQ